MARKSVPAPGPSQASVLNNSSNSSVEVARTVQEDVVQPGQGQQQALEELPEVKVNKWALAELKTACDDAVKLYFSRPITSSSSNDIIQFTPSHRHVDIRLFLGYLSSFIALSSSGWAYFYKVPFRDTRTVFTLAVSGYLILNIFAWMYAKFVEKDEVFSGKRKVFAQGRIETQILQLDSSLTSHSPIYHLSLKYLHSSNGGKTLIREFTSSLAKPFNQLFDENGTLVRNELEKECRTLLGKAMEGL